MKIYVGNLPFSTTSDNLREIFASHGNVASAEVLMERGTDRSRGFGFVEMPDDGEATNAIQALNGAEIGGRSLRVNEARPKTEGGGYRRGGM